MLRVNSFFRYYMFHPSSPDLSGKEQLIAKVCTVALLVLTVGIAHLFCYLFLYQPKIVSKKVEEVDVKAIARLIVFYAGLGKNSDNCTLKEIWNYDDATKSAKHNFIQWLFPTMEPSRANSRAPVLTELMVRIMRETPKILENVRKSFDVILKYYGLMYDSTTQQVVPAANFDERKREWFVPDQHNHARITRILTCLNLMGLNDERKAFFAQLERMQTADPTVKAENFERWVNAAN